MKIFKHFLINLQSLAKFLVNVIRFFYCKTDAPDRSRPYGETAIRPDAAAKKQKRKKNNTFNIHYQYQPRRRCAR